MLHPIFFDLCSQNEDGRYDISRPWVKAGYVFATDGAMILRSELNVNDLPGLLGSRSPEVLHMFADPIKERIAIRLCQFPTAFCPACFNGCRECWGTGETVRDDQIIGGLWFGKKYLTLLQKHGVTQFGVGDNDRVPARFIIGNVEGLLAPKVSPRA